MVLKLNSGIDRGKAQVTNREGQPRLTRVNVWIKMVIIIIFKLDLRVDPRLGSSHRLGRLSG